ncbi:hypothetical protein [Mesorhizobium sp. M1E.F.Ca.ET.063.01.1.1]|uniref:hypothetical protein n=1 Tax=Mesorhizobium sp. M1E.F.Ca.ET.063.01.1.1 TaxID=2496750 RepID=UPI000FCA02B6|nr:hypothetical protein [Mesorhizobium sp. M1E.F.Ca.ET.063.01.1.1]RUW83978.1 hypothetical protein EOA29_11185 [Mesorhizobium sp. M1E.F.Ca.ET.063.01.1.1]
MTFAARLEDPNNAAGIWREVEQEIERRNASGYAESSGTTFLLQTRWLPLSRSFQRGPGAALI